MKSKVTYSRYANTVTAIIYALCFIGCIATVKEKSVFFVLLSIYLILFFCGLYFGVAYIKVNQDYVIMGSILRQRRIPLCDIESVELYQPKSSAIRLCASDGLMGFWGIVKEREIGRYYAFYGNPYDCFLVCTKNGKKYLLGCDNPSETADYIGSLI